MSILLSILIQIDWSDLQYTVDDFGRTVYSFPVHIRVLLAVTLIFLIVILILLGVILGSRIYKTGRSLRKDELKKRYQKIFSVLLFEEHAGGTLADRFDPKDTRNKFHRETLMEEIIHLHENFTGEAAERLEEIYMRLNFHFDSIAKLKNKRWYVVAKGMREVALMNVRQALPEVTGFINHPNEILRMEARIAIMKLSDNDPLSFLSRETTPLSSWDMANIYSMLTKMPEKMIPDFSLWLNSTNKDVVLFSIQMIGTFRQQDSINILLKLLKADDERIRIASIKALKSLNAVAAESPMIEMFYSENNYVRNEILKALEVVGSKNSSSFLEQILRQPVKDYEMAIQATKSLLALGQAGNTIVEDIYTTSGKQMQLIINHAKDKRL